MESANNVTDIISNVATALAAVAALFALRLGWIQIRENRLTQSEATAKDIYREYLRLALEYPQYSLPDYSRISADENSDEFKQYEWFVSFLIYAAEEILAFFPDSEGWRATITSQFEYHREYLQAGYINPRHYTREVCELIEQVRAEGSKTW